jgi:hypothetical protein
MQSLVRNVEKADVGSILNRLDERVEDSRLFTNTGTDRRDGDGDWRVDVGFKRHCDNAT